jgi:hypothetical protein
LRLGLVPDEEYVLVDQFTWEALHAWYGGGPSIRRIVRPVPDSADVRVALYPEVNECGDIGSEVTHAADAGADSVYV